MEEIWKDIEGYEGLYQVSNFGNVKSVKRVVKRANSTNLSVKERLLKERPNHKGYKMVSLSKNGKGKFCTIHRLVAKAFIPNPQNLPQVNHKDEDKMNNHADNLEWCTNKYNINYNNGAAIKRGVKTKREKYDWKEVCEKILETKTKNNVYTRPIPVNQFTWDGVFIKRFRSSEQVSRELGIYGTHRVAQGLNRHAGGYIWLFDEDVDKIKDRVLDKRPEKRIVQYDNNGNFIKTWKNQKEASKYLGLTTASLCACLHGRTKTCGGYIWKYYE